MSTPQPGRRVRGSSSGRPIMAALDLLGRRWTLRILWELREGPLSFRALRDACGGVSPAVLNTRLTELREVGVVESTKVGYAATPAGHELCEALAPLQEWARRWSRRRARPARAGARLRSPAARGASADSPSRPPS